MSDTEPTTDLAARLERLEARLAGTLDVQGIRIIGRAGPVLELGVSPDGEAEIVLLDAEGRDRALLRIVEGEGSLELLHRDGRPALRAASGEQASRIVAWTGGATERRVELRAAHDGTAAVAVVDGRDAVRVHLGVAASGETVVRCEPGARAGDAATRQE